MTFGDVGCMRVTQHTTAQQKLGWQTRLRQFFDRGPAEYRMIGDVAEWPKAAPC